MARRRTTLCLLLLCICLIILIINDLEHQRQEILYREPYHANSIIDLPSVIRKPGLFHRLTRFQPDIWLHYLLEPLLNRIKYPRHFTSTANLDDLDLSFERVRVAQVEEAERLFRWNIILTIGDFGDAAWMTDQHISTLYRDFHHISNVVLHQLSPTYLYAPEPNSWEYIQLQGAGAFAEFPNVIYSADVVKFSIVRPSVDHRAYFDGHHWEYNMGMWVACDGFGIIHIAIGPCPGATADLSIWEQSRYTHAHNINDILHNDGLILFDGIYAYYGWPFLTPFTSHHGHIITAREQRFNLRQRRARVIIENVFALIKNRFQILYRRYRLSRSTMGVVARVCFILNNIILLHQCPMGDYS